MEIVLPNVIASGIFDTKIAIKNNIAVSKNRKTTVFEIELPIESTGVSYIDDESAEIIPEMLISVKPGQTRHTRLPFKCYYVHMVLNEGYLYDLLYNTPNYININNRDKYLKLFEDIIYYNDTGYETDKIKVQSLLLDLIYNLVEDGKKYSFKGIEKTNRNDVGLALRYIENNLTADLQLDVVSNYLGFSPIYFHNFFKSATGKTLREYVEERRIKMATNMLISTSKTLTEIAYDCGFSSQSYFSYAFKRRMKCTPREYVKNFYKRYET